MERINESKSLSLVILEPRTNFRTFWELEWPKNQMTRRALKGETKSGNNIMNTIYVPKSERYSWIRVTRATLLKKATTNLHQYIHYSPRLPSPICRLPWNLKNQLRKKWVSKFHIFSYKLKFVLKRIKTKQWF